MSESNRPAGSRGTLEVEISAGVAERMKSQPRECYGNAVMAIMVDPVASTLPGVLYVEGMALYRDTGLPVEHGWLETNGAVIDPTAIVVLRMSGKEPTPEGVVYFPAYSYALPTMKGGAWRKTLPLWHAAHGFGDPAMRAAHNAAWSEATGQDFAALMEWTRGQSAE